MTTQAKIIKVYAYHGDGGEMGYGPLLGYTTEKADAVSATRGKGWYGSDAHISELNAIQVGDEVYLLSSVTPIRLDGDKKLDEELRAKTIAGLTPQQKRALGLK